MRMMLRVRPDMHAWREALNETVESGKLPKVLDSLLDRLKPEAVYFTPLEGGPTCIVIFDMQNSSQMPAIAGPLLRDLGAKVELSPVMTRNDLQKGIAPLQQQG
ncbi:hypothetical protein ACIRYZ_37120 [Kitasatospora sp. NPDC101155]|uniref:hypothetical protein n=1 Tax=Kitasatospora sp. NPDC101155 TaxID=3364097 RepID=UPI003829F993